MTTHDMADVAEQPCIQKEDPDTYTEQERRTFGCWWANGRYYAAGHVKWWRPLPEPPATID